MNARCANSCQVVGFKHRMNWKNLSGRVYKVHQYWIIPKQWNPLVATADLQKDFYTRHGLPDDQDGSWLYDQSAYLFDEPCNPERYTVIKQNKFLLGPGNGTANLNFWNPNLAPRSYVEQDFWIPLNRKFTYGSLSDPGELSTHVQQPPVIYVSFVVEPSTIGGTQAATDIQREAHLITFFRDGESGMR